MDGIISATSLAAESLRLGDRIGTLAAGYEADIIAVAGDPMRDITALRTVTFVMKGGTVYKKWIGSRSRSFRSRSVREMHGHTARVSGAGQLECGGAGDVSAGGARSVARGVGGRGGAAGRGRRAR